MNGRDLLFEFLPYFLIPMMIGVTYILFTFIYDDIKERLRK